jgi:hypothetical protein
MKVGFTGTQRGLTITQLGVLYTHLKSYFPTSYLGFFHHGDCVGADAEAAKLARGIGYKLYCHPPTNNVKRAFVECDYYDPPRPYLIRNRVIVAECDLLIGCPGEHVERLRSGTWSTLRYAKKVMKNLCIIFPDGRVKDSF